MILLALLACSGARKYTQQGDEWMEKDNYGAAARSYDKALEAKGSPELELKLARALLADDRAGEALPHARAAEALPGGQAVLAEALVRTFAPEEALGPAQAAGAEGLPWLVEAEIQLGRLEAARGHAEAARAAGRPLPGAEAWLAARAGKAEALEALLADAELEDPTVLADLAGAWWVLAKPQSAAKARERALMADATLLSPEGLSESWTRDLALAQRLPEARLRLGVRLFAMRPESGELAWAVGKSWVALGDQRQASTWLARALELAPYASPESSNGVSVLPKGDVLSAEQRLQSRADIARELASSLRAQGRTLEEIAALQIVVRSGNLDDQLLLADAYQRVGRADEAERIWLYAANKGHVPSMVKVAKALQGRGKPEEALRWALQAVETEPANVDAALLAAELQVRLHDQKAARATLEACQALNPRDPRLAAALAKL